MNVSIEATDFIARWERLDVQILSLKRLLVRRVGFVPYSHFGSETLMGIFLSQAPGCVVEI
jgi:hypothetical protein